MGRRRRATTASSPSGARGRKREVQDERWRLRDVTPILLVEGWSKVGERDDMWGHRSRLSVRGEEEGSQLDLYASEDERVEGGGRRNRAMRGVKADLVPKQPKDKERIFICFSIYLID